MKQLHILRSILKYLCFVIICFIFSIKQSTTHAQNCSELLEQAQEAFRQGHPEDLMKLKDCLNKGFSIPERIEALKLITIAYVLAKDSRADSTFQELFRLNPEFKLDLSEKTQPAELIYLYHDFHTDPRFWLRAQVGVNTPLVNVLKEGYGIGKTLNVDPFFINGNPGSVYTYNREISFNGGVNISLPLFDRNVRINTGVYFYRLNYAAQIHLLTYGGAPSIVEETSNFFTVSFIETQNVFQFPVYLSIDFDKWSRYNFEKKNLVPFLYGGFSYHIIQQAELRDLRRTGLNSGPEVEKISSLRNTNNLAWLVGAGVKIKIRGNQLLIDARYHHWLKNVVNSDNRYGSPELLYRYGYIDHDFSFQSFSISLGYEIPIYNPTRRKHTN